MEGVGRWQPETQKRGEAEGPKSVLLERDDGAALLLAAREADPCVTRGMVTGEYTAPLFKRWLDGTKANGNLVLSVC